MKKRVIILIILCALLLLSAIIFFLVRPHHDVSISFDDFLRNGEFQYRDLDWFSSVNSVKRKTYYTIEEDSRRTPAPQNVGYYRSKSHYTLDGVSGTASFDFYYGTLRRIQFSFVLENGYEQWFKNLIENFNQQFGLPSDEFESVSEQLCIATRSSKWETERSRLQVVLITGENRIPSVEIIIGVL